MNVSIVKVMMIISYFCLFFVTILADNKAAGENECGEARCGDNGTPIRFPFRLKSSQPSQCGYPGFDLSCTTANQTVLELPNIRMKFFVTYIDYKYQYINLNSPDKCGLQKQNLKSLNLSISPFFDDESFGGGCTLFNCSTYESYYISGPIPCLSYHGYYVFVTRPYRVISAFRELVSCRKIFESSFVPPEIFQGNQNFSLSWSKPNCSYCDEKGQGCRLKKYGTADETECFKMSKSHKGAVVGSFVLILSAATAIFHVYTSDKKEKENRLRIKTFLEDYKALKASRYAYADIKKITNQLKEKLGEGAYGTVFKGKLSNDVPVAVKILNNFKGNGEEFINEVRTMGQIHHVNVVRLVGYCAEGLTRALIYEFLPNDSLDKYILSTASGANRSLSWEIMQDIALGIAKGIDYLHQGCEQRILHFDIKPHNILLDHDFKPKISDFGLARLCAKDQSIVSMATARGTIGYIAPEVFSKNFGNVSYKSDVYSFGMLLLEMVGGRKNTNKIEENASEIYYPEWIYNLLEEGKDLRIQIEDEGDSKIAKKLAIVGLWCIQWYPQGRLTMKVVVQMLQDGGEELTMPPNPFASIGPSKAQTKTHARYMNLELDVIDE
ncbi:hypothetical protein TIFTF001_020822 [Ficus carica]|uniref:Protein kinase domain-containing protein n=1 Tax=Ficus carica TaxID=3494 RepID=A0AA88AJC4_FICCA|nr:hypothetical protein TIFTF001_020822 [Ficus carica]